MRHLFLFTHFTLSHLPTFPQPQGEHIELFQKRHGKRLDANERA
jgi:hypothetical protein